MSRQLSRKRWKQRVVQICVLSRMHDIALKRKMAGRWTGNHRRSHRLKRHRRTRQDHRPRYQNSPGRVNDEPERSVIARWRHVVRRRSYPKLRPTNTLEQAGRPLKRYIRRQKGHQLLWSRPLAASSDPPNSTSVPAERRTQEDHGLNSSSVTISSGTRRRSQKPHYARRLSS